MQGRVVFSKLLNLVENNAIEISLNEPAGIYILELINNGKVYSKRIEIIK
jgi:hypothetical protein